MTATFPCNLPIVVPSAHSPEAGFSFGGDQLRNVSADSAYKSVSRHGIGYKRQGGFRAIDVILYRGRPAHSDRPDDFSVYLDWEPASPRCHTRQRGDAGQERRVALDKVEELLRGDADQSCVRLVLRHLDAKDRSPIHPAKGLEIAPVIENRYVLADAKFSGLRHRRSHHFLCQLRRDAVFLHHVRHWTPSFSWSFPTAFVGLWRHAPSVTPIQRGRRASLPR